MPTTVRQGTNGATAPAGESIEQREERPVGSTRGAVSVEESVVEKIAATAGRNVPGIYPAGDSKGFANGLARAFGVKTSRGTEGIRARIRGNRYVSLEMRMAVDYGERIPNLGQELRFVVAKTIREMTDLDVREIKVRITEVLLPATSASRDELKQG